MADYQPRDDRLEKDSAGRELPPRVLVVDDDATLRQLLTRALGLAGYDAASAAGGAEGFAMLRSDSSIRLVVLDLMMPDMDGWRFRHAQGKDPRIASVPTVILTGAPLSHIVHAELQAADYLLKPVGMEHFLGVVSRFCGEPIGA